MRRFIQFPNSLLARVLRERYYRLSSTLQAPEAYSSSYVWKSLLAAKPILSLRIKQMVHSGYQICMWEDPWIPTTPARPARLALPVAHPCMTESEFIHGMPRV